MPHHCDQCKKPITTPTGKRRTTILCPHDDCKKKTSLYAVLYDCLFCGRRLESPLRDGDRDTAGSETACPHCHQGVRVPWDVLRRDDGSPAGPDEYGFRCLHCHRGIRANRRHARLLGVCPHCLKPVDVPLAGYALGTAPATPSGDPREVLRAATPIRCPRCREEIPKASTRCPFCGQVQE
jgi:hypothetical protein